MAARQAAELRVDSLFMVRLNLDLTDLVQAPARVPEQGKNYRINNRLIVRNGGH
jgi:hypothetical protein